MPLDLQVFHKSVIKVCWDTEFHSVFLGTMRKLAISLPYELIDNSFTWNQQMKSSNCKSTDKIGFPETNLFSQGAFAGRREQYVRSCVESSDEFSRIWKFLKFDHAIGSWLKTIFNKTSLVNTFEWFENFTQSCWIHQEELMTVDVYCLPLEASWLGFCWLALLSKVVFSVLPS